MKKKIERITALLTACTILLSFAACTKKENNTQTQTGSDIKELSLVISSHASWPYNPDWPLWKWYEEGTGVKFNVQAYPGIDLPTKLSLLLASPDTLPDLLHLYDQKDVHANSPSGTFVSISDNLDKLPNYTKFVDSLPKVEADELKAQRTSGDGKMYCPPSYGTQTSMNLRSWIYRKDILDKHNLTPPISTDELYTTCKKLKQLYPKSYPLSIRDALYQIENIGPMWKNNFTWQSYYDTKEKKWCYGALDTETMTEIINFFKKMHAEGLVPPDYVTISTKAWEELVSTDRGFIMPDYLVRIDFFNKINRKADLQYSMAVMAPPKGSGPNGQAKMAKTNIDAAGFLVCNTGKEDRMNKSFEVLDWMYSDEACELLSWGKEGESYKVVNGKKEFILDEGDSVQTKYGIGTCGAYVRINSFDEVYSDEQVEQGKIAYKTTENNANPCLWLPLNKEEMKVYDEVGVALKSYCEEHLSKFLMGQKPMSEWDAFQKGLKDMGVDRLLAVYTSAYSRIMK